MKMNDEEALENLIAMEKEMRNGYGNAIVNVTLEDLCCAISALKNQAISDKTSDKYRWHDLRKDPKDLPEELSEVNITWVNHNPVDYYKKIKDIPFSNAMGIYCNGRWWWWSATCKDELEEYGYCVIDAMDEEIEVIAWREIEPFDEDINVISKDSDDFRKGYFKALNDYKKFSEDYNSCKHDCGAYGSCIDCFIKRCKNDSV